MKTQIIQLERHDDIVSTRDKMTWGKTPRLLLVWPEHEHLLNRRLDLVLIQRHSQSLGAQLAFVTGDAQVREFARELGIPCFHNIDKAQQIRWRRNRKRTRPFPRKQPAVDFREQRAALAPKEGLARTELPGIRLASFGLGLAAVFILMAVLFPTATVDVQPKVQTQNISLPVSASAAFTTVNPAGQVPVHWTTVVEEGQNTRPASGTMSVPAGPATGQVTFTNLTDQPVDLPAGTVVQVLDQGPRFLTTRADKVAAGAGKQVVVPIQALNPGSAGNVSSGEITAIEGPLGLSVSVQNEQSISGGSDRSSPSPSGQDQSRLRTDLLKNLQLAALTDLLTNLGTGKVILTSSIQVSKILTEKLDPAINTPSDHLTLSLQVEYKVGYVSQEDLSSMAKSALDAGIKPGYQPIGNISLHSKSDPLADSDGVYHWALQVQRKIAPTIPADQIIRQIVGQEKMQAAARLSKLEAIQSPAVIHTTPSWWPWLPYLPFRIRVSSQPSS